MTVKISGKNTWIVLLCFPIKLLGKLYCEITDIWKTLIQNLFIVFKNIYSIHVYTIITIKASWLAPYMCNDLCLSLMTLATCFNIITVLKCCTYPMIV